MQRRIRPGRRSGIAAVLLILVALAYILLMRRDLDATGEEDIPAVVAPEQSGAPPADAPSAGEDLREGRLVPGTSGGDVAAFGPTLDIVRVDAEGGAVVAGRGDADREVVLRLDGAPIATGRTDRNGDFVTMFDLPPAAASRLLTLETRDPEGAVRRASDNIIVAPTFPDQPTGPDAPQVRTAAALPASEDAEEGEDEGQATRTGNASSTSAPGPVVVAEEDGTGRGGGAGGSASEPDVLIAAKADTSSDTMPISAREPAREDDGPEAQAQGVVSDATTAVPPSAAPDPVVTAAPDGLTGAAPGTTPARPSDAGETQTPDAPVPPRLLRAGPSGISVVAEADAPPQAIEDLGIDAITYDLDGEVELAGHAAPDSQVRIYLDNRAVQLAVTDATGVWTSRLPDVASGVYTLRIDRLAADGSVADRIETPFQRTAPEVAAAARRDGIAAITVQPGYTLWAISEGYFGDGIRYVQIFEANRSLIRNPDLIFPGQVFALPEAR